MRNLTKFFMGCILFIICISTAYSQTVLFSNFKVTPRFVSDPDIQAGTVVGRGTNANARWLQIDVDFVSKKLSKRPWLDNVTIKYDVLLPKATPTSRTVVLSGQVEYWSIAMNGEEHHAQAFIHPRILQRYAPALKMRKNDLKDIRVLVTILINDAPVGMGWYKMKTSTTLSEVRTTIGKALSSPNTFKGRDLVYGRDMTPWGVLNTSYYDLIKRKK